jgi:hypothetical protein
VFSAAQLPNGLARRLNSMHRQSLVILMAGSSLALVAVSCASRQSFSAWADQLEKQSWELAGSNAVDCGRVPLRSEPKAATACAVAANKAGKPFRVLYDVQGIDSFVAEAYVRSPDGTLQGLLWDSDPSGGGRRGPGVVNLMQCPSPVHFDVNPQGRLTCFPPRPLAPRNAIHPNLNGH